MIPADCAPIVRRAVLRVVCFRPTDELQIPIDISCQVIVVHRAIAVVRGKFHDSRYCLLAD